MADLKTNLLGFVMNSPIIGASGTVGYGVEYEELADFTKIGGISGKGLTLHGQYGNKGERLWETPSGLINSIGLQNPGVQHFIDVELNEMLELQAEIRHGGHRQPRRPQRGRVCRGRCDAERQRRGHRGAEHLLPERQGGRHGLRRQGGSSR